MAPPDTNSGFSALTALRRFAQRPLAQERCELCALALAAEHAHLLDLSNRRLVCACDACAILFSGHGSGKYRRIPRRAEFLPEFRLDDVTWQALQLPVNMAFFVQSFRLRDEPGGSPVTAYYPSPGGATEAEAPPDAWQMIVDDNPVLAKFEPDVEALLVNRIGPARECYRAGIDECYKLVGLIRTHWHGFSGGSEVWEEIDRFFAGLKQRAGRTGATAHA